ncbi:Guanine Nucleotide-Binding Protein-Like 1 [Manis pentadactyla]|nr:Guanine Nucleotide-Binding Protein-Like 1 [Manis pentadactyla]
MAGNPKLELYLFPALTLSIHQFKLILISLINEIRVISALITAQQGLWQEKIVRDVAGATWGNGSGEQEDEEGGPAVLVEQQTDSAMEPTDPTQEHYKDGVVTIDCVAPTELFDTCEPFATVTEEQGEVGDEVKDVELFTLQKMRTSELCYMAKCNYDSVMRFEKTGD